MKMNSDSTPSSESNTGRTPPPNVIVPPGYIYMTVGDKPESFTQGVLLKAFADYSVALGRVRDGKTVWLGSGVLVRKGKHFGILTAHHCLHACSPEVQLGSHSGDKMCLVVNPGRSIFVEPEELLEHELVVPKVDEFGPDLTFIEILSPERLGTFKAAGTFWSLDRAIIRSHERIWPALDASSIGWFSGSSLQCDSGRKQNSSSASPHDL
jgi:hypothetical protein